jgi:hypothetical protein
VWSSGPVDGTDHWARAAIYGMPDGCYTMRSFIVSDGSRVYSDGASSACVY